MMTSTLSFSTSLRTLLRPSDGSEASSSRISWIGRPSISAPSSFWPKRTPFSVLSPRLAITFDMGSITPTRIGVEAPTSRTKAGAAPAAATATVVSRKRRRFMERLLSGGALADPEVALLDGVIGTEVGGGAVELDAPLVEHVAAVREVEHHSQVLLDEEHGHAARVDALQDPHQALHEQRHEPAGQLVDEHEPRLREQP